MKKAAIYIRVSTLEQANEGYSIPAQKERLTAFCKAHDWLIADIYVDSGYSGSNLDRPGIQRLMGDIGKFEVVLVYKLDRLSRSQRDTLHLIEEVFIPAGVDFVSMNESFDTSTPFGRAMIGILSVFAQLEREQIKERTKMGKLERAKLGLFHGGMYFPVGYDYVGGKLIKSEYEAAQIRKIYDWYLGGMAPEKIAEKLRAEGYTNKYGSWSEASGGGSVKRVLSSEVYLGTLRYKEVVVENAHEAIISREDFDRAQALRVKRQEIYGDAPYQTKYLLASMLFCSQCGARYAVKHNYGGYKYYVCYSRARTVKRMIKSDHCENKNWRLDELDERVEAEVKRLLFSPKYYESLVKAKEAEEKPAPPPEAEIIGAKIADIDRQIGRLMDLYQAETMPADVLSVRIDKLYREKTALVDQLSKIEPPAPKRDFDTENLTALLADFADVWDGAEPDERRVIIQALIDRIWLDGENIRIEWAFLQK